MRIAYVTTYDARDVRQWAGTGFYAAQALSDAGADVNFIGPLDPPLQNALPVRVRERLYSRLLRNRLGAYHSGFEPSVLRHYASQVEHRIRKTPVDVVFSPGTLPIAYLSTDLPIVFWSDATFAVMEGFYPAYSHLHHRAIRIGHAYEHAALKKAALALYSSAWAARSAVRDYGADPSRVKVVPYGANIACERTVDDVVRASQRRSASVCRLLFIGQDWERKGGPQAVRIAADLRARGIESELTVVGCTPPETESVPEFVRVLGFVAKTTEAGCHTLNQLFAESHFFLLPTVADCTPIVFAEANSFGVPVITTAVGGIATLIRTGVNGVTFSPQASPEDYGRSIAELFTDRIRYTALVRTSFEEYHNRLNWRVAGDTVMRYMKALPGLGHHA
jgi:glycosyltransferase involved in cell wall biosynthesis